MEISLVDSPGAWEKFAACKGKSELFFAESKTKEEKQALAICKTCLVVRLCREATDRAEASIGSARLYGIFGGETPGQRLKRRKAARKRDGIVLTGGQRRQPIEHGTLRGYKTHRRRGEAACEMCLEAMRLSKTA